MAQHCGNYEGQMRVHSPRVKRSHNGRQLKSCVEALPQDPGGRNVPCPAGNRLLLWLGHQAWGPSWPPPLPLSWPEGSE